MTEEKKELTTATNGKEGRSKLLLSWLDTTAKLAGALAIVGVAVIANRYQSEMSTLAQHNQNRLTGITLQSQREQSESQLRANMFSNLIDPLAGSVKGKDLPPKREALLVELLALNFSDNFELKPLMQDVDRKLAAHPTNASFKDERESLRSIASRVADRQIAALDWGRHQNSVTSDPCDTYYVTVTNSNVSSDDSPCSRNVIFQDSTSLGSPDGMYDLQLVPTGADWKEQTVHLSVNVLRSKKGPPGQNAALPEFSFTLSWYDLPLTDNTLLSDGNRFAINLRQFEDKAKLLVIRVVWFPKDYFTPRERPLNYEELRELLNITPTNSEGSKNVNTH